MGYKVWEPLAEANTERSATNHYVHLHMVIIRNSSIIKNWRGRMMKERFPRIKSKKNYTNPFRANVELTIPIIKSPIMKP